jgi:glucose-1-phosphatase
MTDCDGRTLPASLIAASLSTSTIRIVSTRCPAGQVDFDRDFWPSTTLTAGHLNRSHMTDALPLIRTVFFDMGNVLVKFSHDILVRQTAAVCNSSEAKVRNFLMEDGALTAFEKGEYSEPEFIELLEHQFRCQLPKPQFQSAFSDIFTLTPGIVRLLQKIGQTDTTLILLSNTSITHLEFIEQEFDVLGYMHDRVTSFEVGAVKPEPTIYAAALRCANCEPGECFYTDDIQDYIDVASELGIHSHQFVDTDQLEARLTELGVLL